MGSFRRLLILTVVTSLLLATAVVPAAAVAANSFDMNDRFSTLGEGGAGHGKIQETRGDAVLKLHITDLAANHPYVVNVTVGASPGGFDAALTRTFPVMTNSGGNFNGKFDLGVAGLASDTYRLDIFVTHAHTNGAPGDGDIMDFLWGFLGNSQALLSCAPFVTLTVP